MVEVNPASGNKFLARVGGNPLLTAVSWPAERRSGPLHEPCRRRGHESLISLGKSETRYLVSYTLREPKRESYRMKDGRAEDSAAAPAQRRTRWAAAATPSVCRRAAF